MFHYSCTGIIVGGSLSYGPFYNVRGKLDKESASDIDAIFILDNNASSKDWKAFVNSPYFSKEEKEVFMKRKNIFLSQLFPRGDATVLSQKFSLVSKDYEISIHFVTNDILDKMLIENITDEVKKENKVVVLKDYKSKLFPHKICSQVNFNGDVYDYVVPEQIKVEEGVITSLPAYIINDHTFYPSIYQNLILPMCDVFYARDTSLAIKLADFKSGVHDYIANKYGEDGIRERLLRSHMRNIIFPKTLTSEVSV